MATRGVAAIASLLLFRCASSSCTLVAGGNGQGSDTNQLDSPSSVAIDSSGHLFIADSGNHRIVEWADMGFVRVVAGGNGEGTGDDQFTNPVSVVLNGTTTLLVSDSHPSAGRVMRWEVGSSSGGAVAVAVATPGGVALDSEGNLYVAEPFAHVVTKWVGSSSSGIRVAGSDSAGPELDKLLSPVDVEVDSAGNLYVLDFGCRVVRWAPGASVGEMVAGTTVGANLACGAELNEFGIAAQGLALDDSDNIWVADTANNRIVKWEPGALTGVLMFGSSSFQGPKDVVYDPTAHSIVVVDTGSHRLLSCPLPTTVTTSNTTTTATTSSTTTTVTTSATTATGTTTLTTGTSSSSTTSSSTSQSHSTSTTSTLTTSSTLTSSTTSTVTTSTVSTSTTTSSSISSTSRTTIINPSSVTTTSSTTSSSRTTITTSTNTSTSTTTSSSSGANDPSSLHTTTTSTSSSTASSTTRTTTTTPPTTTRATITTTTTTTSTSATSTVTTSTSTTNAFTSRPQSPQDLLTLAEPTERSALEDLVVHRHWNSSTHQSQRVLSTAFRVKLGQSPLTLPMEGTGASVMLPTGVFSASGLDELICVVSTFDSAILAGVKSGDVASPGASTLAAMNVKLYSNAGLAVPARDLEPPIFLRLPSAEGASSTAPTSCAYWDVALGLWAFEGVETKEGLYCSSTHLTLFAALLRSTVQCVQLHLLSTSSLQEMLQGSSWLTTPAAVGFWALLLGVLLLFVMARVLDGQRSRVWKDEYFLIPRRSPQSGNVPPAPGAKGSYRRWCACGCPATFSVCFLIGCLQDALRDVLLGWQNFLWRAWSAFGNMLVLCSSGPPGHSVSEFPGRAARVVHALMGHYIKQTIHRQTSASLGFSREAVDFVMSSEELQEFLMDVATSGESQWTLIEERRNQHKAWYDLHRSVVLHVQSHWRFCSRSCSTSLTTAGLLATLLVSFHLFDPFQRATLRVLSFACELLGSLMLAVLLLDAFGEFWDKSSDHKCREGTDQLRKAIVRTLMVGTCSAVLASLPVLFLSSLHSRSLKKFDHAGCPGWRRQLQVWRTQDVLLWVLGLLYVSFCALVVALFLANAHPGHQLSWGVSVLVSFAESSLIAPLFMALFVPLAAVSSLNCLSCLTGRDKQGLLRQERAKATQSNFNWTLVYF